MNVDQSNMRGVLAAFPQQCEQALKLGMDVRIKTPVSAIVFCGIGGSAIPADIFKACFDLKIPIVDNRDYGLPKWVGKDALVLCISYSGNTEETIDSYREAHKRGCQIVSLSSGGKLRELCGMNRTPHIQVPSGIQPRDAIGYQTIPLLNVLIDSGVLPNTVRHEIRDMIELLSHEYDRKGKELADKLVGKVPIIYASHRMSVVARAWKTKINENAKVQAFFNEFPELNHNEIVGYTNSKAEFFTIIIEDEADHPRIRKRMEITKKLIQSKGTPVFTMRLTGSSTLAKIFSAIYLGSYAGFELALNYDTDPSPVEIVENLKKEMAK